MSSTDSTTAVEGNALAWSSGAALPTTSTRSSWPERTCQTFAESVVAISWTPSSGFRRDAATHRYAPRETSAASPEGATSQRRACTSASVPTKRARTTTRGLPATTASGTRKPQLVVDRCAAGTTRQPEPPKSGSAAIDARLTERFVNPWGSLARRVCDEVASPDHVSATR